MQSFEVVFARINIKYSNMNNSNMSEGLEI